VDSQTFDEFYGATSHRTLQFAYAMCGDHGVAQDLTQEAYIRAWQRWARLMHYDSPESWLRLVVTRLVTDRWRWLGVRRRAAVHTGQSTVPPPSEDAVVINAALRTLPVRQRQAIVMHYLMDMPVADIAEETGVAVGTVKSWLSRGRAGLALVLSEPVPAASSSEVRTAGDRRARTRRAAIASLCAVLVALVIGAVVLLNRDPKPRPPITPSPSTSTEPVPIAFCRPADLDPRPYYAHDGAAGTAYHDVIVQNVSAAVCKLGGFPGFPRIDAVDATTGGVVTLTLEPRGDGQTPVGVAPGEYAMFAISHANGNPFSPGAPECATPRSYRDLQVIFADGSRYPLPGLVLQWECGPGGISGWSRLDIPLNQVAPEVTRAP
jgi:RNA polymerase sigma-70 factor (sigma-E family)